MKASIKIIIYLLFIVVTIACEEKEDPVLTDQVVIIRSQSELEAFSDQLEHTFYGSIYIGPFNKMLNVDGRFTTTDIKNLDALNKLEKITGFLNISMNHELVSIAGLNNLNSVGGELTINYNSKLTDLNSFNNLQHLSGKLWIRENQLLQDISGFNSLIKLKKGIEIWDNDSLKNITGFKKLKYIGGSFSLMGNRILTEIESFNHLDSCNTIFLENTSLTDIEVLSNLNWVQILRIVDNPKLTNIDALTELQTVHNMIDIRDNSSLVNLDGLSNLKYTSIISIKNNSVLSDFCGLNNLITNYDFSGSFETIGNAYNPSTKDIENGNCRQ